MAYFAALPMGLRARLAEPVSTAFALTVSPPGAAKEAALAESFALYLLSGDDVEPSGRPLRRRIRPTGEFHHQVHVNGRPRAYALSAVERGGWVVTPAERSELARWLDDAMRWIDEQVKGDPEARAFFVPAFDVWAFLLLRAGGGDTVVVADYPTNGSRLRRRREYGEREFLQVLGTGRRVVGIGQAGHAAPRRRGDASAKRGAAGNG